MDIIPCDMKETIKCHNLECRSGNTIIYEQEETWEYYINQRICLDCNAKFTTGWKKHIDTKPSIQERLIC